MRILDLTSEFENVIVEAKPKPKFTSYEMACMEGGHSIEQEAVERVQGDLYTQLENFADGKKKGKSRPGRVKRSGASCKGSVTSLRKKAKNASGERKKMYHWCANMKSGRKKKRKKS